MTFSKVNTTITVWQLKTLQVMHELFNLYIFEAVAGLLW